MRKEKEEEEFFSEINISHFQNFKMDRLEQINDVFNSGMYAVMLVSHYKN